MKPFTQILLATITARSQRGWRGFVLGALVLAGVLFSADQPAQTQAGCAPPPGGMVAWWPGDGNANDIQGSGNGTLQGATTFAPGKVGQAFRLNGTDAFVRVPNSAVLDPTTAGSQDAWVKFDQLPSAAGHIMQIIGQGRNGRDFDLQAETDNKFYFYIEAGSIGNKFVKSTTVIQTGVWYHVAGTWDATGIRIYVNGVLEHANTNASALNITRIPSGQPLEIGNQPFFGPRLFNGLIDEVEVFNRALSQAEIQAIFNAGSAGKCRACAPPPLQMAAWWPGDGNANDIQNGQNGMLVNGAVTTNGLVNQAFSFDGADDAVTTTATALNAAYAALTVDAWVFPLSHGQAIDGLGRTIISKTEGDGFALRLKNGNIQPDLRLSGGDVSPVFTQAALPLNAWSHVAATYDGATIRAYLNGVELGSGSAATGTIRNTANANICLMLGNDSTTGCTVQSGNFGFHGLLDEVEVFTRALTANEIRDLVNAGAAGKCRPSAPVACVTPPEQMTNWWPGDNHTNDIQGAQNGTLNNGAGYITGKVAQAFNFDGVNDFVRINSPGIVKGQNAATIDAWVMPRGAHSAPAGIGTVWFEQTSAPGGVTRFGLFVLSDGRVQVAGRDSENGAVSNLNSLASIPANQWTHIAGTWQAGVGLKLFINGTLDNQLAVAGLGPFTNTNSQNVLIGASAPTVSDNFNGILDEIEVFNRALTQAELLAIFNAGSGGKCHACAGRPAGMVATYSAEGNANDVQGGNNGTLQNGATFGAGVVGQAFNLDGVNDSVSVANNTSLDFGTGNFSLDGWVYFRSLTGDPHIFTKGTGTFPNDQTYFLHFSDLPPRGLRFVYRNTTGNANDHTVNFIPQLFTWYHVAGVREGNTSRIYVNGALLGTQTAGNNIHTGTGGTVQIGRNVDANNRYFNGLIDELSLYNRALTAAEILTIFNAGGTGKCPCPAITVNPAPPGGMLPNGIMGQPYNQTLTATGGSAPHTFASTAGALPAGVTLSAAGVLAGTPTVAGTFNFTVTATDAVNCTGTRAYTLTLINCPTLTVNPATLPNGFVGTAYNQTLNATSGTAPYTFAVSAGTLPGGLNLAASTGVLSGTPTTLGSFTFTVRATDANGCTGQRQYTVISSGNGLQFYPLPAPVRLLDTRGNGVSPNACTVNNSQPITGNTALLQMARGICGIPANAQALTGNVTTVQSGGGFLTLYPSGAAQPTVASTNFAANEVVNNVFTVGLGAGDGKFNIYALTTTDVVVDVSGYYAPPAPGGLFFHALPSPVRLLETRAGQPVGCILPGAPLAGGVDNTYQVTGGVCTGIPAGALAIVGNATTVNPQGAGFLTLFPADAPRPLVAASNYAANQIVNGPFTVGLSATGQFKVYSLQTTELVIDVLGYFSTQVADNNGAGLLLTPLAHPIRLLETRAGQSVGCFKPNAPVNANQVYTQPARGNCDGLTIPANALGVVGTATVVFPAAGGFLTLWPSDAASQPTVATSNYDAGAIVNRHFLVGLGNADGAFKLFSSAMTELVIDLSGYFAP